MALHKFLKERMPVAKELVTKLKETYPFVSVLGSYNLTKQIFSDTFTTVVNEIDNDCGFVFRIYDGKHFSEYSTNEIVGLKVEDIINAISSIPDDFKTVDVSSLQEEEMVKSFERNDEHPLSDEEVLNRLNDIRSYCEKYDERIIQVRCACIKREVSKFYISDKKCLDQYYVWVNGALLVVAREGNIIQSTYKTENEADTLLTLTKLDAIKEDTCELAIQKLSATTIEPGVYDIITDPTITGLIAHEAFGHGVEMDMFVKERAKAANYINKRVASDLVNMHDGASAVLSAASYFFDDDGILASDTTIIENGILKTGISDALSALQLNTKPTGNGRREAFDHKVYTRMTNTFFSAGKDKLEDMIASIKHGYYLCDTNNGMEDPKNWQIQCTAEYGLEIKDGKFTGKIVAPVVMSGYVLELLNSISMVSDQFVVTGSGMCGKGHKEWVFVSDGGPHLKARAKLG